MRSPDQLERRRPLAKRRVWTALVLGVGSAVGSAVFAKRGGRRASRRADLYFDDGSMLSLVPGSLEADRLLPLADEVLAVVTRA